MARPAKPKPQTEVMLSELQDKWFETKDDIYRKKMFEELVPYAKSLCLKLTRGKAFLEPPKVWGIAVDSAASFMDYYQKNPDFKCSFSFAGLLKFKVLENLYGGRPSNPNFDQDRFASLNTLIGDGGTEFGDLMVKLGIEGLWTPIIHDIKIKDSYIKQEIFKILEEFDTIASMRLSFLSRLYLMLIFDSNNVKKQNDIKRDFIHRTELSFHEAEALDLLVLEVRNRLYKEVLLNESSQEFAIATSRLQVNS